MTRLGRRLTLGALAGVAALACTEPDPAPERAATLLLQVAGAAAGEQLEVRPYYQRDDRSLSLLESLTTPIAGTGTQQVTLEIDLSGCLADQDRESGFDGCPLRLALLLRSAQGDVVDSAGAGPLDLRPGGSVSTPAITLRAIGSVSAAASRDTIGPGEATPAQAVVRDRQGGTLEKAVLWRSDQPSIATVSPGGLVVGVAAGMATIRVLVAADSSISDELDIVVRGILGVAIAPDSVTLDVDQTVTPGVAVTGVGVATTVRWSSDDPGVATVDAAGEISAVAPGATVVRAVSVADPGKADSVVVVVRGVTSLVVSPPSVTLDPGQTAQATATVTVSGGSSTAVTWTSRATAVATVGASGLITAVASGATWVVATSVADPSKRDSVSVTVQGVISVSITPDTVTLNAGQTLIPPFTVSAGPGTSTALTWSTGAPAVATVNPTTGLVSAVATGVTVVTARSVADPTKADSVVVQVRGVVSIVVSPDSTWLDPTQSLLPTATVTAVATSTSVIWSSGNLSVASVAANGTISALSPGRAVIYAQASADVTKRDSVIVNVITNWTGPLRLVGSAQAVANGFNLTPGGANRTGGAWTYVKRRLATGFSASYGFQITGSGAGRPRGAHRRRVRLRHPERGQRGPRRAGLGLGYATITRSLAIEFDLAQNAANADPDNNHVSVQSAGLSPNSANQSFSLATGAVSSDMTNGFIQNVTIVYTPGQLQVFLNGQTVINLAIDLTNLGGVDLLDANGRAWVGFTGTTSASFENHDILSYTLP
ncbi:MAG: Ig-like domain-containing protein [Gemmatimonadales bacterium]